jgi:peptide/nickel transport system substrate-binding protein
MSFQFAPRVAFAASGFPANPSPASCASSNTFTITFVEAPNSFNSLTAGTTGAFVTSDMEYSGQGVYPIQNPDGTFNWNDSQVDWYSSNSNYTQWMFNAKPGEKWSNGLPLNASDILATYGPNYAFNPNVDILGVHSEVAKEYALNSSTAVYVLNQSDAHFADKLSLLTGVVPAYYVNQYGWNFTGFGLPLVEWGPWWVNDYTGSTQLVMYRNQYWTPQTAICQVNINYVEGTTFAAGYLAAGKTDFAQIDPTLVPSVLANPNVGVYATPYGQLVQAYWNTSVYPFNQLAFRQAIVYAVNQSQVVQQGMNGYGQTAYSSEGMVPPTALNTYDSNQKTYSYDPAKALSLLHSLGFTGGGNSSALKYPNGTAASLNVWVDSNNAWDLQSATVMQSDLQNLGFNVVLQPATETTLFSYFATNAQDISHSIVFDSQVSDFVDPWQAAQPIYVVAWIDSIDPASQFGTLSYYGNATLDNEYVGNLTAVDNTGDPSQLKTLLNNIQEMNAQNLPALNIGWVDYTYGYNKGAWTGWPAQNTSEAWFGANAHQNVLLFAGLRPASSSGGQGSSTTTGTTSIATTATTSIATTASTGTSTSSTAKASASLTILEIAAIVVVVIIVAAVVGMMLRRRPATQGPT